MDQSETTAGAAVLPFSISEDPVRETRPTVAASPLPKRTNSRFQQPRWKVPIVDRHRRLAGWTTVNPMIFCGGLRHDEAERLVGEPIIAALFHISDPATATLAGAPPGWRGPWRCLGMAAESARPRQESASGEVPTIELQT